MLRQMLVDLGTAGAVAVVLTFNTRFTVGKVHLHSPAHMASKQSNCACKGPHGPHRCHPQVLAQPGVDLLPFFQEVRPSPQLKSLPLASCLLPLAACRLPLAACLLPIATAAAAPDCHPRRHRGAPGAAS